MRVFTPIVAVLAAAMLLTFSYIFRPTSFFGDVAMIGVPLWVVCGGLLVVTGHQIRTLRQS